MPQHDHISMALFCDFENVALGVRDANYEKFDIKRVLERLLLKGSIVVKKAYCDWERYKGFKAPMHEANFELIEIPHVRQSGKNSADIRLVVDALDLCYTKSHVNTFVIISGDSDFSPLVSKLRENAKHVIGVGVKQSTSDLLIANCDEFIYYDDLVRGTARRPGANAQGGRDGGGNTRRSPEEEKRRREEMDTRRAKAVEMAAETYEALVTDRDDGGRIWASVLKEAIKRRNPGFNENYYGFRTFGNLLEEALARGLLEFGRDEKSGTWVARGSGVPSAQARARADAAAQAEAQVAEQEADVRLAPEQDAPARVQAAPVDHADEESDGNGAGESSAPDAAPAEEGRGRRRSRGGRGRNKGEGREARADGRSDERTESRTDTRPDSRGEHRRDERGPGRADSRNPSERAPRETALITEAPAARHAQVDSAPPAPAVVAPTGAPAAKKAPRKTAPRKTVAKGSETAEAKPARKTAKAPAKAPAKKSAKAATGNDQA